MDKVSNIMRYLGGQQNGKSWYWTILVPDARSIDETSITAVVGLFKSKGKYLVIKNKRGWDIPGGHVQTNESPDQAIAREVLEEANVLVDSLELLCQLESTRDEKSTYVPVYKGEISSISSFVPTEEIEMRTFFTKDELIIHYGGNKELLQELLSL